MFPNAIERNLMIRREATMPESDARLEMGSRSHRNALA